MVALSFLAQAIGLPLAVLLAGEWTRLGQYAINGIVVGSIYALAAVGLTLVYGILRIANFAHGDFLTFGAYLALYFSALIAVPASFWWGLSVAALLALLVVADRTLRRRRGVGARGLPDARRWLSGRESLALLCVALALVILSVGARWPVRVPFAWATFGVSLLVALGLSLRVVLSGAARQRRGLGRWIAASLLVVAAAHLMVPLQVGPGGYPWPGEAALGLLTLAGGALAVLGGVRGDPWIVAVLVVAALGGLFLVASPLLLGIALALAFVAAFAVLFDLVVWRRARGQGAGIVTLIIISIGLALALRHAIQMTWGARHHLFPGTILPPDRILGSDLLITPNQALTVAVTVVLILVLHLFLRYSRPGKAMRALSDNMELARVTGIDVDRVILYVWVIAGTLAAVAGILYARSGSFNTNLGWFQILPIFAAVILGGIGSPYGALLGGYTIGIAMETSPFFGVDPAYRLAVGFGILILVLVVRPQGILGRRELR